MSFNSNSIVDFLGRNPQPHFSVETTDTKKDQETCPSAKVLWQQGYEQSSVSLFKTSPGKKGAICSTDLAIV